MIANQLNRAAHRDFDVSLTPAKHSSKLYWICADRFLVVSYADE